MEGVVEVAYYANTKVACNPSCIVDQGAGSTFVLVVASTKEAPSFHYACSGIGKERYFQLAFPKVSSGCAKGNWYSFQYY